MELIELAVKALMDKRDQIDAALKALGVTPPAAQETTAAPTKRGRKKGTKLSAEAIANIRAGQRKRWERVRANGSVPTETAVQ